MRLAYPLWSMMVGLSLLAGCSGGGDRESPASFPSTAATASVTFQWDSVADSDLAGYRVYQSTSSGSLGSLAKNNIPPSTTTHQATNLVSGNTYYFVVTAIDASGNESSASNQISKTIPQGTPSDIPSASYSPLSLDPASEIFSCLGRG